MAFAVLDKTTGNPIDADDFAAAYWKTQTKQAKEHPKENALAYLFYCKCSWFLDQDGMVSIGDSCGNFLYVDPERYEAVAT